MSFRRSYGSGSASLLSNAGGYSSRGYSGYSVAPYTGSSVAPYSGSYNGSYSQPQASSYAGGPYNSSGVAYNSMGGYGVGISPYAAASTMYTPSKSYLNATSTSASNGYSSPYSCSNGYSSAASRLGRATSLHRSKSLPREQRERERSIQRYTPSYTSSTYCPSYSSSGYTNSYLATRGLITKARSKSSGSVSTASDTAATNTLSTASSGYGSSASVRILYTAQETAHGSLASVCII